MIVQLGKKSGYKVITSASKPGLFSPLLFLFFLFSRFTHSYVTESIQLCKESGADHIIDYTKSDVVAEVLKLTNNEGVDVVVDVTNSPQSYEQSVSVAKVLFCFLFFNFLIFIILYFHCIVVN
jgi:dihydrodipicolinate reductase